MVISNYFKDTIDDLVDSLNDSSDTKPKAILRQVDVSNNGISVSGNSASGLKKRRDILNNEL